MGCCKSGVLQLSTFERNGGASAPFLLLVRADQLWRMETVVIATPGAAKLVVGGDGMSEIIAEWAGPLGARGASSRLRTSFVSREALPRRKGSQTLLVRRAPESGKTSPMTHVASLPEREADAATGTCLRASPPPSVGRRPRDLRRCGDDARGRGPQPRRSSSPVLLGWAGLSYSEKRLDRNRCPENPLAFFAPGVTPFAGLNVAMGPPASRAIRTSLSRPWGSRGVRLRSPALAAGRPDQLGSAEARHL